MQSEWNETDEWVDERRERRIAQAERHNRELRATLLTRVAALEAAIKGFCDANDRYWSTAPGSATHTRRGGFESKESEREFYQARDEFRAAVRKFRELMRMNSDRVDSQQIQSKKITIHVYRRRNGQLFVSHAPDLAEAGSSMTYLYPFEHEVTDND